MNFDLTYLPYRQKKLKEGAEYQDWVMERMHKIGVVLQTYASAKGQLNGENLLGLEIKNDQKFQSTGNLCIEIAEKAGPRDGPYVESGIFRNDNTWLYGIGDRKVFFIFAKSQLRNCYANLDKWKDNRGVNIIRTYETPTSKGFLLPIYWAEKCNWFARKITFDWEGDIEKVECGGAESRVPLTEIKAPVDFQMRLFG